MVKRPEVTYASLMALPGAILLRQEPSDIV